MFDLTKKHCQIGIINNRIEVHGENDVTAFDIPITLLLDPNELNDLLGDKYKHRALFDTKGTVATPMFPEFGEFVLKHDLDEAGVTLHFGTGGGYEISFEKSRLKGISLTPLQGGETECNFKLQVNPQNKHITKLLDAQKTEIEISVADAKIAEKRKRKQRELPLGADPAADDLATEGEGFAANTKAHIEAFEKSRKRKNTGDQDGAH